MGRKIHILTEEVSNQIAAGEIIERPASVLKELIENSIDAGATQIDVETRSGGISWIKVKDDGCGMCKEDAFLCLERHATSKIVSLSDFSRLTTYGFRGEAIPAIASVAKFSLATQEKGTSKGIVIEVHGGKIVQVNETGGLEGTTVAVSSLFFNVPARLKFLKSPRTELLHLQKQLIFSALSHPEIGIRYDHSPGGKGCWEKGEDFWKRISSVFGETWAKELLWIEKEGKGFRIFGAISKPGVGRPTREDMFFFVNKRPVESKSFSLAVIDAYRNSLMKGLYPLCVLFAEVSPDEIDVNVHPTKKEVRFKREYAFRNFVSQVVLDGLKFQGISVPSSFFFEKKELNLPTLPTTDTAHSGEICLSFVNESLSGEDLFTNYSSSHPKENQETNNPFEYKIVGLFSSLYIAVEIKEGILLIDQHAAHERVLFEKMIEQFHASQKQAQKLLTPILITLSATEAEILSNSLSLFEDLGFEIRSFGISSFLLESVPTGIKRTDYEMFLREVLLELVELERHKKTARLYWQRDIALSVCKKAVKSGDLLTREEQEKLVRDLFLCKFPHTCPHGRPTWIKIEFKELEKQFGRIGVQGCEMKGKIL